MKLSEDLNARGLIKDKTFEDVSWLDTPRKFYLGVDCSSDSLTVGNLAIFMLALRLRQAGWQTVLLVGGATSLIGDPGGKDAERELKSREEIERNVAGVKAQVQQLFAEETFELVDNYDWFKDMGYLEFLRDVGKHFSMTELVQRDFIASRMNEGGSGISYAEFSYNLIQGYDFWYLYKNNHVELQIGGSDQWGNMLSGAPLVRKKENAEVHALSMPLVINKATGRKFGKSEEGTVWLDPKRTSPTEFYQFWINVDDDGVEDYLKVYTLLSLDEITDIVTQHHQSPEKRYGQRRLAQAITTQVHGEAAMQTAEVVTNVLTGQQPLTDLDEGDLASLRAEIPVVLTTAEGSIIEALTAANLVTSNSEARRLLESNGVSINGHRPERTNFEAADFQDGRLLLRKGKKFKDSALVELS